MSLPVKLSEEQRFWLMIAGGAVVILLLWGFWARPVRKAVARTEIEISQHMMLLRDLQAAADQQDIPSLAAADDRKAYRVWLDEQAKIVEDYLDERAALLGAPLSRADNPSPAQFKEDYLRSVGLLRDSLERNRDTMAYPRGSAGFPSYKWAEGGALPDPKDYDNILRQYRAREYLYLFCRDERATAVHRLETRPLTEHSARFSGLPFQLEVSLPPDRVKRFVEKLLATNPRSPQPLYDLSHLAIESRAESAAQQAPSCRLTLHGWILVKTESVKEAPANKDAGGGRG